MARRSLLACAAFTLAAPAFAPILAQVPPIIVDQLQWGDVFADMTVVSTAEAEATASALAAGNSIAAANTDGDMDVQATQDLGGAVFATATVEAGNARTTAVASAQGNTIEAQTENGNLRLDAYQNADGGDILARATASAINSSQLVVVANAAANNVATSADTGDLDVALTQDSAVSVYAFADADACCVSESVVGANAAANAWSSESYTSTVAADITQRATEGEVYAASDAYQVQGYNVTNAAAASGNSINAANQWGYLALRGRQENEAAIRAEARTTLATWEGVAATSAFGVGNSALVTNVGSDIVVDLAQVNTGGVDAEASFTGGTASNGSGEVILGATAIGNAFTGYVCSECADTTVTGVLSQNNGGSIRATGTIRTNSVGAVIGSASAIGNSATFITTTPRN